MSGLADIATIVLVSAGALLFLAGALGLLRFPDTLSRLHAISKADNLGLGLIVLGLLPQMASIGGRPEAALHLAAGAAFGGDGEPVARARRPSRQSRSMMLLWSMVALVAGLLALAIHVVSRAGRAQRDHRLPRASGCCSGWSGSGSRRPTSP